MLEVLIAVDGFTAEHLAIIQQALGEWGRTTRIAESSPANSYRRHLANAQVVIGWPLADWLLECQVRYFQLPSVGYEQYVGCGLENKPILQICNLRGLFSIAAAEHFMAMMYCLARKIHLHAEDKLRTLWRRQSEYWEIAGSTVCIVGMGGIGTEIAKRCAGVGMQVLGVTRQSFPTTTQYFTKVHSVENIHEALEVADHVVLCFPASAEYRHFFNADLFSSMKPGACFYNVARGSLVDESALRVALNSGHLRGAGLDVFEDEPLSPHNPLWQLDNVIITPHAAGRSTKEHDRICQLFVDNLGRFYNGQPLRNRILESR